MNTSIPQRLRTYIKEKDSETGRVLDFLWYQSKDIHDRMNRGTKPESNESGLIHVQMVEYNLWRLLNEYDKETGKLHLERFEVYELFLMSAAVCCHDFDKTHLPTGYEHGGYSGEIVVKNYARFGLSRQQAEAIKQVIEIHNYKKNEFIDKLNKLTDSSACPLGIIKLRLIATLLKTADILHADESRISPLVESFAGSMGLDLLKYQARYCTDGWKIEGPRIVVVASPENQDQAVAFRYSFYWMKKNEWKTVESALREYRFPHLLESECRCTSDMGFVEVIVKEKFEKYDDKALKHLKDLLIDMLLITEDKISVIIALKGSIRIVLTLPLNAILKLKQIANDLPDNFISVGVTALYFEDGTERLFKNKEDFVIDAQYSEENKIGALTEQETLCDIRYIGSVTRDALLGELMKMFPRVDRFLTVLRFYNLGIANDLCFDSPMQTYMDFILEIEKMPMEDKCHIFRILSFSKPGSTVFKSLADDFCKNKI